jgi:hypothetical protein
MRRDEIFFNLGGPVRGFRIDSTSYGTRLR